MLNDSKEQINTMLTGVSGRVDYPEFNNQTINTGLTLMKKVDGTDATNTLFTFKIRMWVMDASTKRALTDEEVAALTHKGVANTDTDWLVMTDTDETVITVPLRNGRKVTIGGLVDNMHYVVQETAIGSTPVSGINQMVEQYQVIGADPDGDGEYAYSIVGDIGSADAASVVYNNKYTSTGSTEFTVQKLMQNQDNSTTMSLVDGQFVFTLSGGRKTYVGTNDASGNVYFTGLENASPATANALSFTQEDMAGAKVNHQGYLEKEITYLITESEPADENKPLNLPSGFDYNNVIYDQDKTITLILTDLGNGTIRVTPKNGSTDLAVQIENKYKKKAKATLEGEKVMEGRPLTKGEFLFDAKLIKVGDSNGDNMVEVSEAAIAAQQAIIDDIESTGEAKAEATTAIETLRSNRQQARGKASPIDVIGANEPQSTGTTNTYTASITFPDIYYTALGTYVYEITENTTNMPVDARQKEDSTKTYSYLLNQQLRYRRFGRGEGVGCGEGG